MKAPLRIAVNGRALQTDAEPAARLTAANLVRSLAPVDGLHLDVIAVSPLAQHLTEGLSTHLVSPSRGASGMGLFDQVFFPRAAARRGAQLMFYLHPTAPIAAPLPTVSWWGDGGIVAGQGRLDLSLARAGLRGANAVLRPNDNPDGPLELPWVDVPPSVPADFFADAAAPVPPGDPELPESFVLAFDESKSSLAMLLAAWTWVESSLGDTYILVVIVRDESGRETVQRATQRLGLSETVRAVNLPAGEWPAAFRRASALLHGGERGNAAALRWALAGEVAVAALETPVSQAIVGPAGYLVTPAEARSLGAACLTLLVEEEVAASLREKAKARARSYRMDVAVPAWIEALRRALQRPATGRARRSPLTPSD